MFQAIAKLYQKAGKIGEILLIIPMLFAIVFDVGIGTIIGANVCLWLEKSLNTRLPDFILFIVIFPFMSGPLLIDLCWDNIKAAFKTRLNEARHKKRNKKITEESLSAFKKEAARWYTSTFGITPHLDEYIGLRERLKVIKSQKFYPYREGAKFIKVCEDDKWVKIFNKYYPLDLIYGYDHVNNELYFIDGYVVKLPRRAYKREYNQVIDLFFDERGYTYDNLPSGSKESFNKIVADSIDTLEAVDWSGLRYKWEVAMAEEKNRRMAKKGSGHAYKPLTHSGKFKQDYFIRALSEKEIELTADVFRYRNYSVTELTSFDSYVNEYCVCNGVKVLGNLGYPKNAEGVDFLFTCLKDADEAFFMPAVDVLSKIPLDVLAPIMEKKAMEAYKRCDVLRLAGILYLAKNVNYEIEYVKELKQKMNADDKVMTAVDENGIVRFAPDQDEKSKAQAAVAFKG